MQHEESRDNGRSAHLKEQVRAKGQEAKARASGAAKNISHRAREQAYDRADRRRTGAAEQVSALARAVRHASHELEEENVPLASYGYGLGDKIEDVSHYLEQHDAHDIMNDVETLARKQPLLFLGGAFGLGFLVGRVVRAGQAEPKTEPSRIPVEIEAPESEEPGSLSTGGFRR